LIKNELSRASNTVSFGQNISTGSCLSGLTRGLPDRDGSMIVNTPNIENTQTGIGFGLMLEGVNGIFCLKQQDFLLLGVDHIVNSWNAIRIRNPQASFTIMMIVVDHGFEGPQSCLNNLPDLCSISRISGYTITCKTDADRIIGRYLISPGVRMIGVSQRLFNNSAIEPSGPQTIVDEQNEIVRYGNGDNLTVVSLNFATPEAMMLIEEVTLRGINASLFVVTATMPTCWEVVVDHSIISGKIVLFDDTKSLNRPSDRLLLDIELRQKDIRVVAVRRTFNDSWAQPSADRLEFDLDTILGNMDL